MTFPNIIDTKLSGRRFGCEAERQQLVFSALGEQYHQVGLIYPKHEPKLVVGESEKGKEGSPGVSKAPGMFCVGFTEHSTSCPA